MKTVPVVPDKLRKRKYRQAVEDYVENDRIDEDELEREIENALVGRVTFDEVLTLPEVARAYQGEQCGDFVFYGVSVEYGDVIEQEETPGPFDEDPFEWV